MVEKEVKAASPKGPAKSAEKKPVKAKDPKAKTPKDLKDKASKDPKDAKSLEKKIKKPIRMKRKRHGRLYAKAVFTGFKRGLRNQHENTALLDIEGCTTKADSWFYVGKKCVFVYKGKKRARAPGMLTKRKTKIRAIWGKVTRPHGSTGSVRAKFKVNLPANAMGRRIRIMMYPSSI